jgi:hypothetical protein
MFFLLQERMREKALNYWDLKGLVTADSVDKAVEKVGMKVMEEVNNSESFTFIENGKGREFLLEKIEEITTMPT